MHIQGGIFPTSVSVHNCSYKDAEWMRNISLIMFRFPSRRKDGSYDIDLSSFAANVRDSLNPNGWVVMFSYGSIENKLRPFEAAAAFQAAGLYLVDIVIINRPWWGGKKSDTHLALSHEYVFIFSKNFKWYLDRSHIYEILSGDKYEGTSCPGNSWDLKSYNHNEVYSVDLAMALMKMLCLLPGSVVLDPFMGGASGIEAAVNCGHSFIGFESDTEMYAKCSKVLKKVKKQIEERDNEHSRGNARDYRGKTDVDPWIVRGLDEYSESNFPPRVDDDADDDSHENEDRGWSSASDEVRSNQVSKRKPNKRRDR